MTGLELIKARLQRPAAIVPVLEDKEAHRVLSAWQCYPRENEFADFVVKGTEDPRKVAGRLWEESKPVDFARLAKDSDVPETRCIRIFERLLNLGLVWPDGTISVQAGKLLTAISTAALQRISPRWRPQAPAPASSAAEPKA
jgi:hypothetical protein